MISIDIWNMAMIHGWHDSFLCVIWLISMCDGTHFYVWRDSFLCVTWLISVCDVTRFYVKHDTILYETWHKRCDSFLCVTWLISMCDMTHFYVWRDSILCVTRLNFMWNMTHAFLLSLSIQTATWGRRTCSGYSVILIIVKIIRLFCKMPPVKEMIFCKRDLWMKKPNNRRWTCCGYSVVEWLL